MDDCTGSDDEVDAVEVFIAQFNGHLECSKAVRPILAIILAFIRSQLTFFPPISVTLRSNTRPPRRLTETLELGSE